MGVSSGHIYMEDKQRTRKKFKNTLIYPDLDVESICDVPRVPRTHLDVVFAQTIHVYYSTPVLLEDVQTTVVSERARPLRPALAAQNIRAVAAVRRYERPHPPFFFTSEHAIRKAVRITGAVGAGRTQASPRARQGRVVCVVSVAVLSASCVVL